MNEQNKNSLGEFISSLNGDQDNLQEKSVNNDPKNNRANKGKHGCLGLIVLVILLFGGCSALFSSTDSEENTDKKAVAQEESQSNVTDSEEDSTQDELLPGDTAVLRTDIEYALLAVSEDALEEYTNYVSANNKALVQRMIDKGELVYVKGGTPIAFVDMSWLGACEIEVLDGDFNGYRFYTIKEFMQPL